MRTKRTLLIAVGVAAFAGVVAAQVAQYSINATGHYSTKREPGLFRIKSSGELVAEVRFSKPYRLAMDGIRVTQPNDAMRTAKGGSIEIAPEGLPPWRLVGEGLEVEFPKRAADAN